MREKTIGNVLRDLRCEQGYSIDEVSAEWAIPVDTLRAIEAGEIDKQFLAVVAYGIALDADLEALFKPAQREVWEVANKMRFASK
ncbi:MAG: hypothetical protein HKN05_12760 [Rhizobiales bacterium]|nr:hypothetical protein [Hyphomicrobiales bacterium]